MKVSYVSSAAVSQAMRYSMLRMQAELVKAQQEATTGRVADVGLALGGRTGQSVSLARDIDRLGGLIDSNALVDARLTSTQAGLTQLHDGAQTFFATLTASFSSEVSVGTVRTDAQATLEQLTGILNSSLNGEYLFAGINTDVKPLDDFNMAGSPAKAAFDAAFLAEFGFAQSDPQAAGITAAAMEAFLAGSVEAQFLGAGWSANWSRATDQTMVTRIGLNETARTSVSANESGIRKLAMAAAMVAEFVDRGFSADAEKAVIERAVALVSEAMAEIAQTQSATGLAEQRVAEATERLTVQIDIFERHVIKLEGVDPYEASTRVSALLGQIELSYSLTARINELSLARFL